MIDPSYPCKLCGCPAWSHYKSISVGTAQDVCFVCYGKVAAGTDGKGIDGLPHNAIHVFEPDNLQYLENKEIEENRQKGQPGIGQTRTGRV